MSAPRVSVLMTCYNRERYLAAAIESVLAQTFSDFELLVVDDRSGDGSVAVAREYERRDPRVRVFVNDANLGDYGNRNRAASLAQASFLKYHDSDDLMYPHCLATLLGPLQTEPRAAFALSSGGYWPGGPCPMLSTPQLSYRREFLGLGMFSCGPAGALFRTAAFRALGGFEERGAASDYLFWLRACRTVDALLVPGDLFWYRIHAGQELHGAAAAESYALAQGEAWLALHAPDCPLAGKELEQARRNHAWTLAKLTWRDLRAGRRRLARLRLGRAGLTLRDALRYVRPPRRAAHAGTPLTPGGELEIPDWSRFDPERPQPGGAES